MSIKSLLSRTILAISIAVMFGYQPGDECPADKFCIGEPYAGYILGLAVVVAVWSGYYTVKYAVREAFMEKPKK